MKIGISECFLVEIEILEYEKNYMIFFFKGS